MKQSEIVAAYKVINKIRNDTQRSLPLRFGYALHKTRVLIQDQFNFQVEREQAILEKYKPEVAEDGSLNFGSKEEGEKFTKEFQEEVKQIADMDVDLGDFTRYRVPFSQAMDMPLSDIEALDPFIEFVDE